MAVDKNVVNAAVAEFLQADADVATAETQLASVQTNHAKFIQAREEAKAKVVASLG